MDSPVGTSIFNQYHLLFLSLVSILSIKASEPLLSGRNEFKCAGTNITSDIDSLGCVGHHIICDNDDDDDEGCFVDCYDENDDSNLNEYDMCYSSAPGCCKSYIQCPDDELCEIRCSYSCQHMIVDAANAAELKITECTDVSCFNLTVYCPDTAAENSCTLLSNTGAWEGNTLSDLEIFTNHPGSVHIEHSGTITGTVHCLSDENISCSMDASDPSLCTDSTPIVCSNVIENTQTIHPSALHTPAPITKRPTPAVTIPPPTQTNIETLTNTNQDLNTNTNTIDASENEADNEAEMDENTNEKETGNQPAISSTLSEREIRELDDSSVEIHEIFPSVVQKPGMIELIVLSALSVSILTICMTICIKCHNLCILRRMKTPAKCISVCSTRSLRAESDMITNPPTPQILPKDGDITETPKLPQRRHHTKYNRVSAERIQVIEELQNRPEYVVENNEQSAEEQEEKLPQIHVVNIDDGKFDSMADLFQDSALFLTDKEAEEMYSDPPATFETDATGVIGEANAEHVNQPTLMSYVLSVEPDE